MWWFWAFNKVTYGICHFLAIYPGIFWASEAVPIFKALRKNPLPQDIPYRQEIFMSQGISAILSVILTIWMVPSGLYVIIGSLKKKGYGLVIFCLIEWSMIGLLITSLVLQSHYLPPTIIGCRKAKTWQLVGNDTNLFGTMTSNMCSEVTKSCNPKSKCRNLLAAWILSITFLILFCFAAVFPLLHIPIPWRLVWLYGHLKATPRLALHLLKRLWQSMIDWVRGKAHQGHHSQKWRKNRMASLYDVLNEDKSGRGLISLAKNLHYSDIVSLSLTSSAMHRAVFPNSRSLGVVEATKVAACETFKSECWCCGIEICKTCEQHIPLAEPGTKSHIESCQPYCSGCYYKVLCRRYVSGSYTEKPWGYNTRTKKCPCRATVADRAIIKTPRPLCKFCAALDHDQAVEVREAREQAEINHLTKQQLRCVVCTRGLQKEGLRWWGCSLCVKECTSDYHPMWDKKSR